MGSHIRIELANGQIKILVGELLEPQRIKIAGISTTLDLPVVRSRGVYDLLLERNWLRVLRGSGDYGARTTYRISGDGRTVVLWNTRDGCILVQIETNKIALEAEQVSLNCRGTRTGPPLRVDLRTPVIILGRKGLMIAAAGKILSLREEVSTRLSTLKRVKYQEQDQYSTETFLHCMP